MNNALLERARLQELERERRQLAQLRLLPTTPGMSQGLRRSAGEALIALGTWIKPRATGNYYSSPQARLAGR